jgi:hypothetical protein
VVPVAPPISPPPAPDASATPYVPPAASTAPAPAPATLPLPVPPAPVNAYINFGSGPYPEQAQITTGNAQAWYSSPQVAGLFGGSPTTSQQQSFTSAIIQRVEQTFSQSGVPITLTSDPTVPAGHALSVVSSASSLAFPGAIGTTNIGSNGFTFIDPIAKAAQSVDQLEWIVAHNVSHELMLAFGVGENYDKTGNFVDAPNASFAMMTNPNAAFSPAAAAALLSALGRNNTEATNQPGPQMLDAQPVPEPATIALWVGTLAAVAFWRRKTAGSNQAS